MQCHDPHGSQNIKLVRETITTPGGANRPITFDNLTGLADGSFANASAPGTGVCEICHTTTNHYRMDGTGSLKLSGGAGELKIDLSGTGSCDA